METILSIKKFVFFFDPSNYPILRGTWGPTKQEELRAHREWNEREQDKVVKFSDRLDHKL